MSGSEPQGWLLDPAELPSDEQLERVHHDLDLLLGDEEVVLNEGEAQDE